MRKVALQIGLSILGYFFLLPIQACQPELAFPYVIDLEDGKHVFAMQFDHDNSSEFPVSGVYLKGPVTQLVWEYHDSYISAHELEKRISADGRYYIKIYPPLKDIPAYLEIYDNGKLIGKFGREIFVDDVSQFYRKICTEPYWARLRYDKQINQVQIESMAKRVVTIDVPSAQILSVDKCALCKD